MDVSLWLAMPAIIILGLLSSFTDILSGKIRNRHIFIAILYSFVVIFLSFFQSSDALLPALIHLLLILLLGFSLWYANFWSAGDAKLFIAYAFLIPLGAYTNSTFGFFPAFDILINTFVPLFFFYGILLLARIKKSTFKTLLDGVSIRAAATAALFVFGFSWFFYRALPFFLSPLGIGNNVFLSTIFLLAMATIFKTKDGSRERYVAFTLCAFAFIDFRTVLTLAFLKYALLCAGLYVMVRYVLLHLSYYANSTPIFIENLKPGMMVAENFRHVNGTYEKVTVLHSGFVANILQKTDRTLVLGANSEGLDTDQIESLTKLHSSGEIKEHTIRIYSTLPFSPFIFMGVLITIVCEGSLFLRLF